VVKLYYNLNEHELYLLTYREYILNKFVFLADTTNKHSLACKFRKKRQAFFEEFMSNFEDFHKILDVGGTQEFWNNANYTKINNAHITLLNLKEIPTNKENFISIVGNATEMKEFQEKEFDVVFSNSVIEHLFTFENQLKMAEEIKRIGKKYFIQTPNKNFPIEPHFIFPFWQYLPEFLKVWLLMNFKIGHCKTKIKDKTEAQLIAREIRLLTKKELLSLFPGCKLYKEKILFFTKSFIVYN